jgi:hypothetical protein
MGSILNPIDSVVDLIGVNDCLHALDRTHTQDDSQGDSLDGSQDGC